MQSAPFVRVSVGLWMAVLTIAAATTVPADNTESNMTAFENAAGQVRTFNVKGETVVRLSAAYNLEQFDRNGWVVVRKTPRHFEPTQIVLSASA